MYKNEELDINFVKDNVRCKLNKKFLVKSIIFLIFMCIGMQIAYSNISDTSSNTFKKVSINQQKVKFITQKINETEEDNLSLESKVFILKENLSKKIKLRKEKTLLKFSNLTASTKQIGPGVVIYIDDKKVTNVSDENPNLNLIHNTDLLNIVNDLWAGGAKSISINGQRVVSSTDISCAGPVILLNKTRIAAPFEIKAIGNPKSLNESITQGFLYKNDPLNISFKIENKQRLEIVPSSNIISTGEI